MNVSRRHAIIGGLAGLVFGGVPVGCGMWQSYAENRKAEKLAKEAFISEVVKECEGKNAIQILDMLEEHIKEHNLTQFVMKEGFESELYQGIKYLKSVLTEDYPKINDEQKPKVVAAISDIHELYREVRDLTNDWKIKTKTAIICSEIGFDLSRIVHNEGYFKEANRLRDICLAYDTPAQER